MDELIKEIIKEAKIILEKKPKQPISHMFDHGKRVWKRAKPIALETMEDQDIVIDLEILEIVSRLHDINESHEGKKKGYSANGAKDIEIILKRVNYPETRIEKALRICSEHFWGDSKPPESIEAQILFEADNLDGLGPIGIARFFAFSGQQELTIDESVKAYEKKIKEIKPLIRTDAGKRLAAKELKYTIAFLEKIKKEKLALEAI